MFGFETENIHSIHTIQAIQHSTSVEINKRDCVCKTLSLNTFRFESATIDVAIMMKPALWRRTVHFKRILTVTAKFKNSTLFQLQTRRSLDRSSKPFGISPHRGHKNSIHNGAAVRGSWLLIAKTTVQSSNRNSVAFDYCGLSINSFGKRNIYKSLFKFALRSYLENLSKPACSHI